MPLTYAHLDELEAEAIYVIREAFAQFEHPGILFSGGKDSIVVTHLAAKAFAPAKLPFPLVHIDTGHNFPETLAYRDALVGGARRDEENARAKERFFSHRDDLGQWDPKNQRPELWNLFNGKKRPGEHFRVFPISNWTELDVWHYIRREGIELPELYFARPRNVVWRNNAWLPVSEFITLRPTDQPETRSIRFRTLGDITITGGIASEASTLDDVIREIESSRQTERGNREDDKRSENSMEERKREGYF